MDCIALVEMNELTFVVLELKKYVTACECVRMIDEKPIVPGLVQQVNYAQLNHC